MGELRVLKALREDLPEILKIQKDAFLDEAKITSFSIEPMTETLDVVEKDFQKNLILKAVDSENNILGSVRGKIIDGTTHIFKLSVSPSAQRRGVATLLLSELEKALPERRYELFTRKGNERTVRMYINNGFKVFKEEIREKTIPFVFLEKIRK
ncbi:MAG: GNAT family N-acetyltransferase [Deltaproteobacteria bacterium]|jgi:ribosomal protein S18 acetylase RimI-like enzyme|nr:GNAT family N-acetyltransferase [Deltaproteobacteria bacterium]